MNQVSDIALFRFSVLGPLTSRIDLSRGDIQTIIKAQAEQEYDIHTLIAIRLAQEPLKNGSTSGKKRGCQA